MISFSSFSIKNKITLIVLLVTAFSLVAGLSFVIVRDIKTFREDMRENFVGLARVIADYSVVDLAFADRQASAVTLSKLATVSNIEAIFLFDASGNLFSSYDRAGVNVGPPPELRKNSVEFGPDALHIYQPVTEKDIFYGTVYLRISTSVLNQKIRQHILTMLILLCGLILISAGIAIPLQSLISNPILDLAKTARKISEEGDYSIRVDKRSDDEIGVLCEGFNNMLSQIENKQQKQMKAEAALRESEDRYRGVVESSPEAIFVEQNGHIEFINSAGLKMLGYRSREDMKEISLKDLFATGEILPMQESETAAMPLEARFKGKDGTPFDVELSLTTTVFQGKPAVQFLARDVTEIRNFQRTAQRMERLASIGEFAATIAHEIRNPLGSISLNFRFLSDRMQIPEPYIGKFHSIEKGIERIQDVIRGILDFSRPAPPDLKAVSIHQIIDSSILTVEKEIQEANVSVIKDFDMNLPDLLIDPTQISQVFVNLFLNAIQAMKTGGNLTIKTELQDSEVQVTIKDTGAGISHEHLARIYDPFFTTRPDGVGLGLAVVVRTLEQHGATIAAVSKVASGTRFVIHFPLGNMKVQTGGVKA